MSKAMPGPNGALRFALLLLIATVRPPGALAEGNVGCLFSHRLCLDGIEECYDDYAFGRCLSTAGNVDEEDLYRYDLDKDTLHILSRELRRLFALGYRWSHGYTQCRLQGMLFAARTGVTFEHNTCFHLADQDLEGALKALEGQVTLEPDQIAVVKYTPSEHSPHGKYADEVYYPPVEDNRDEVRNIILPPNAVDVYDIPDPYHQYEVTKRTWIPQMHRRSPQPLLDLDSDPDSLEFLRPYPEDIEDLPDLQDLRDLQNLEDLRSLRDLQDSEPQLSLQDLKQLYPFIEYLSDLRLTVDDVRNLLLPEHQGALRKVLEDFEANERAYDTDVVGFLRNQLETDALRSERPSFTVNYNTPNGFRNGWESRDSLDLNDLPESRVYAEDGDDESEGHGDEDGSGEQTEHDEIFRELKQTHRNDDAEESQEVLGLAHSGGSNGQSGVYTEGGVVYVPDSQIMGDGKAGDSEDQFANELDELLERYTLGFKRPERLDVKKPGPPFDSQITPEVDKQTTAQKRVVDAYNILPAMMKKEPRGAHPNPSHDFYDANSNFIFIKVKDPVSSIPQAKELVKNISNLLNLGIKDPYYIWAERNEITFRLDTNKQGLNATEVAKRIGKFKDKIKEATGVEVVASGVDDGLRLHMIFTSKMSEPTEMYVIGILLSGIVLAIMVAACILVAIRRHIISKEKLHGLARPDTEASKDYQDLCRARMSAKTQQAETVHGRITSLSRESEQSPSSRSSTSSWSEEPALHNMDISTGHMVLSYMEDHLCNKDRLEQEWVALCAYEAEPCATVVALKKENVEKNRYPEILPYDHARVVLNDLSNASGSDYINASSITDHDPRNPAYIAAQGPLPLTAPDFWQLIWEQGAVVIVMLTRLTEGGAAMCHRYWPEEGSEVYHVYEVHLVSEHIWCDDYLVRSFYLKNTRTGETRTVTQFHFLSWPEGGIPSSTKALLEFRRKVNKSYRGRSCPIVVHCSDGAGRTGTYCLMDMVLSRMTKGAKEIDIAATLEHLRDQRPRMVATKQQFEFVLTAVAEEVHAILKALPPPPAGQAEKEKEKQ